jgi:hypothetical protein
MTGSYYRTPLSALHLFDNGLNTLDIAAVLGITEAQALEELTRQRSNRLRRPVPYSDLPASYHFRAQELRSEARRSN